VKHVADTHVLVWWMLDDPKLERPHRRILEKAERTGATIGVSAISLWEIAKLAARRRLELAQPLDECLRQIETSSLWVVLALTGRIAAESTRLGTSFPADPADQLVVATARCHGLTLLTADDRIRSSGVVAVA
jgi:PIN domain nuclease of toxin-antitoxin system